MTVLSYEDCWIVYYLSHLDLFWEILSGLSPRFLRMKFGDVLERFWLSGKAVAGGLDGLSLVIPSTP